MKRAINSPLAWVFLAIIVVGVVVFYAAEQRATDQALQNYENQMAACIAGNPVREAVVLAVETAAHTTTNTQAAPKYAEAAQKILAAPDVMPSGARNCSEAIERP